MTAIVIDDGEAASAAQNYTSVSALRAYKVNGSVISALVRYTNAEISVKIALAEGIVESITGDVFYTKTETNRFDGQGLTRLFFIPKIPYQLISVTSLKEYDLDQTTVLDTFVAGTDYLAYPYYIETAKSFPGDSPRRRFGTGGVWPKGQKNIVVEGTWGRATTPAEIIEATNLLALEMLVPGSTRMNRGDIQQLQWSDFQIMFQTNVNAVKGTSTGFVEVDRLLANHINYSSMFLAIPEEKQTFDVLS